MLYFFLLLTISFFVKDIGGQFSGIRRERGGQLMVFTKQTDSHLGCSLTPVSANYKGIKMLKYRILKVQ